MTLIENKTGKLIVSFKKFRLFIYKAQNFPELIFCSTDTLHANMNLKQKSGIEDNIIFYTASRCN